MYKQISFINKFALIILCVFSSCQKDDPSVSQPVVNQIEDYFPLQVGNYWEFKAFNDRTFKYQIDSIKNLDGKDYFRMLRSGFLILPGTDTVYYRKDPYWIVYERKRTTQDVLKVNFGVPAGYKWENGIDNSGHTRWASLSTKTDTVKCGNFTFENCYRYFYNVVETADEEYWWFLAPGVGFVKDMNTSVPPSRIVKARINGVEHVY